MIGAQHDWDHVIIGAGSAGCVLADRLSERTGRRVLLLEAGPDTDPATMPDASGPVLRGYHWDHRASVRAADPRAARAAAAGDLPAGFPYPVGKVVGGSSAVNGAIALRAMPRDFDRWAGRGNPDWAWEHLRGYVSRVEENIPVHRPSRAELDSTESAFWHACTRLGLPELDDLNRHAGPGVGVVPVNAEHGRRVSTAVSYLARARHRPNLTVWAGCTVTRVLLDGHRAVGVQVLRDQRLETVLARQVTLSAGATGTPLVLLRSGIGDPALCRSLGIRPAVCLPGVGRNLMDHPVVGVWAVPRPGVCRAGPPWHRVAARVASRPGGEPDLDVLLLNNVVTAGLPVIGDAVAAPLAIGVSVLLHHPHARGQVRPAGPAPDSGAVIELGFGADPRDVDRLMAGLRVAWSIIRSPELASRLDRVLLWTDRMVGNDTLLARAVTNFVSPSVHPAGTARMGRRTDPAAVVDQHCRVHGVAGLRVVDASVLPVMPSAPLNLTCIAIAERAADWINHADRADRADDADQPDRVEGLAS